MKVTTHEFELLSVLIAIRKKSPINVDKGTSIFSHKDNGKSGHLTENLSRDEYDVICRK